MTRLTSLVFAAATLITVASAVSTATGYQPDPQGFSFVDRFETFDRSRWKISHGWSNGNHQDCTWYNGNVKFVKGNVDIVLNNERSAERNYTCSEIQSVARFGYGTYEVRMRAAAAPGLVSAFFTYAPRSERWPGQDEIDFEFLGKDPSSVQLNYFAEGTGENRHDVALGFDASMTVNDYAFEWLPDSIRWYVNGKMVHEVKKTDTKFPKRDSKIVLSIWNGVGRDMDSWLGRFNYPGKPLTVSFELVAFTAAGNPCQFDGSIVCKQRPAPVQDMPGAHR